MFYGSETAGCATMVSKDGSYGPAESFGSSIPDFDTFFFEISFAFLGIATL